jgi:hypothetical protein
MTTVATAMDTEGATSANIPAGTAHVGMYVSGTGSVPWSAEEQERFPENAQIRIYQGSGTYPGIGGYDMIDVETGAVTPAQATSEGEKRVQNEYQWTIIYATRANLLTVSSMLAALPGDIFAGHFAAFLADWSLSETEAEALLGTEIGGMGVVGVQWASPSSNPNTLAPGTDKTLSELNIDLSVVDASFFPVPRTPVAPTPPVLADLTGMVVYEWTSGDYISAQVVSADGGGTWTRQ